MATAALGGAYVLTDEGARELAALTERGSAPSASPGFTSHLRQGSAASARLATLSGRLVSQASRLH